MKKLVSIIAVVLLLSMFSVPALAHGHGGNRSSDRTYPVCNVENCDIEKTHQHDGTWYCGHTADDGHDHHHGTNENQGGRHH